MRRILAGVVLSLMLTGAAVAGPLEEGVAAYQRGDYSTAVRLWRPLAEQGDAFVQWLLGIMYDQGQGVPQDDAEAVKWYRLAAEQGLANAQNSLGVMYKNGEGVNGEGVPQDDAEAVKWYRLAAEQGYAAAQHNLGNMYATGEGVPQDDVQAHMWFTLAASRYLPWQAEQRDQAAKDRDIVASKMTPAQRAEAERLAREWKPK